MTVNVEPKSRYSVEDVLDPASVAPGTVQSAWIDMKELGFLSTILEVGTMATDATLDALLEQATDGAGADAKAVTGKALTQLTEAGGDSDTQAVIDVGEEDLDIANNFRYVRLSVTVAADAVFLSALLLGFNATYYPKAHITSVTQAI